MTRGLSTAKKTAIANPPVRQVHFVALDFPSGFVYLNSTDRRYELDLDGDTVDELYLGAGRLGSIQFGDESAEGRVTKALLTFSGIQQSYIQQVLAERYRNRPGIIYRGYVDADEILVDLPEIRLRGLMQPAPMRLGPEATVSVEITSRLAFWERGFDQAVWDHQDHQFRRPGDTYHRYSAELAAGRTIPWGRS